jgi:hypothetical protein
MATVERSVLIIDRPDVQQEMTPQHRVRPLTPAGMRGDFAATDPLLALMRIGSLAVFSAGTRIVGSRP